jgi:DNA-binding IclR family transcriptional regulator
MADPDDIRPMLGTKALDANRRQRVQSAETGADILKALARLAPSAALSRLADELGMPAAKAHRYLQSFIASGLAEQDPLSGRYRLGPEMLAIGLTALGRLDITEVAAKRLGELRDRIGQTCLLAVWGNRGPTVVLVREAPGAVTVVTRVGSVLPLLGSATGLAFAAFLARVDIASAAFDELHELQGQLDLPASPLSTRLEAIRKAGLAEVHGLLVPGIDALAAPVFGFDGGMAGVIATLGPNTRFEARPESPAAEALLACAKAMGAELGAPASSLSRPTAT